MGRLTGVVVAVLVAMLTVAPMLAVAGNSSRLIPMGKVGVLADGKEVNQYTSETSLPEGALMVCDGNCIVQSQGLQLVARDKAVFAAAEEKNAWNLVVKNGRVDFGIRTDAKPVTFRTPHDMIQIKDAIIPAGSEGIARGSIVVTDEGTQMTVQEGMLRVATNAGEKTINAGQTIVLAQAKVGGAAGGGAAAGGTAGGGAAGGLTGGTALAAGAGGLAIIGGGIALGTNDSDGDGDGGWFVSPF